jgi:hypothetical protein
MRFLTNSPTFQKHFFDSHYFLTIKCSIFLEKHAFMKKKKKKKRRRRRRKKLFFASRKAKEDQNEWKF